MAKLNGVKTIDMVNGEITKVAYEGAEYTKVVSAEVGDLALCTDDISYFTKGEYYEVIEVDNDGDVHAIDDEGDRFHMYVADGECALFRKISAQSKPTLEQRVGALESDVAALKGEKVAEESKRLTVGDIAKIIGHESGHFGEIGDIVKIVADDKDDQPYQCERISDGRDVGWFYEEDLVAYNEETIEFEGTTYRKVDREAREGDVVIFRKTWSVSVDVDKPYKVVFSNYGGGNSGPGVLGHYRVYSAGYGRTRETVDVYEPIEQAKYIPKEGDIVVVTANTSSHANKIGDIGKVGKEEPLDDGGVNVYVPGGPLRAIRTKPCDIRKATPAEVEKYEQAVKDAEIASKWAKIGRKPNEFKEGDVVRVLGICNGHEIAGQLGEVVKPDGTNRPSVRAVYNDELVTLYSRIELVAPVESLFNA